jgi:hypothetical protein
VEVSQRAIQIGEAFIRRIFTVTAVKLFTPFIARVKIVYRPILSNRSSSDLNILGIVIGSISIYVRTKLFQRYTNCEFFIFTEFMASSSSLKTLLQ